MTLQTVTIEQPMKASCEEVWRRISTPEGIASWWRPGDIQAVLGHMFTLDMGNWGQVSCKVIETVHEQKLAYTFGEFELHWTLMATRDGCLLTLEHKGFDLSNPQHIFAFENMSAGWRNNVLPRLARDIEAASGS